MKIKINGWVKPEGHPRTGRATKVDLEIEVSNRDLAMAECAREFFARCGKETLDKLLKGELDMSDTWVKEGIEVKA